MRKWSIAIGAIFVFVELFALEVQHMYFSPTPSNVAELVMSFMALAGLTVWKVNRPRKARAGEQETMLELVEKGKIRPSVEEPLPQTQVPVVEPKVSRDEFMKEVLEKLIVHGGIELEAEAEGTETFDLGGLKVTLRGKALPIKIEKPGIEKTREAEEIEESARNSPEVD